VICSAKAKPAERGCRRSNFASNRFIYVYSTSSLTAPGTNRVLRLKVNDAATAVSDRVDIVTDIQYKPRASNHPFGGPGAHNGGAFASARATAIFT